MVLWLLPPWLLFCWCCRAMKGPDSIGSLDCKAGASDSITFDADNLFCQMFFNSDNTDSSTPGMRRRKRWRRSRWRRRRKRGRNKKRRGRKKRYRKRRGGRGGDEEEQRIGTVVLNYYSVQRSVDLLLKFVVLFLCRFNVDYDYHDDVVFSFLVATRRLYKKVGRSVGR